MNAGNQNGIALFQNGKALFLYQKIFKKELKIMTKTLKEKQVEQAKLRLRALVERGLLEDVEKAFLKDGTVYYSENGILYWLTEGNNCDEMVEIMKRVERETGALVYFAILSHTEFGDCLSLLLVGKYQEEWKLDLGDLKEGYCFTWTENLDCPECSEFGSIGFKPFMGGLARVW